MTEATLIQGLEDTGLPRRSLILRSLGLAGGALATVPLVALVGGDDQEARQRSCSTRCTPRGRTTPPSRRPRARSRSSTPTGGGSARTTSQPGGIATVFPGVREENEYGYNGITDASSPTLIIRLRPGQKVKARKGQAGFGWPSENPEYLAFSKICTHAGCPASLYEQQTSRLLCPCHQSQFQVLEDAKPVFGPATRSLPKLPLGVYDGDGRAAVLRRPVGLQGTHRPRLLGAFMTSHDQHPDAAGRQPAHAAGQGRQVLRRPAERSPARCASS